MHPANGGKERTVTAHQILALASDGHRGAVEIRDSIAAILSDVIINISVLLDPSMIDTPRIRWRGAQPKDSHG